MLLAFARGRGTLEIPLFPRASWLRHRCSVLALRQEGTECVKDAGVTMLLDGTHRKKKLRSDMKNHLMAWVWEEAWKWKAWLLPFSIPKQLPYSFCFAFSRGRIALLLCYIMEYVFMGSFSELQLLMIKSLPLYHVPAALRSPLRWSHCGSMCTNTHVHFVMFPSFFPDESHSTPNLLGMQLVLEQSCWVVDGYWQ